MRFGICGDPEKAAAAKKVGFDYFEWSVGALLCPLEGEDKFKAALEKAQATGLPCEALNVFVPGQLPIVGPAVDFGALERYVETALRRAATAKVERIVFGSGGARKKPDGFDDGQAWEQLVKFGAMVGETALAAGVTVAIEPLNDKETNTINSVAAGAKLMREVDSRGLRLLVDSYHWELEKPARGDLAAFKGMFKHTHTATMPNRMAPGLEPHDFVPFFKGLRAAEYDERLSIEGALFPKDRPDGDLEPILAEALSILKQAHAAANA